MAKSKQVFKPAYSNKGFLIEFQKFDKQYWIFIFIRFLSFVIDIGLAIILWAVLYFVVFKNIYLPLIIPIFYYLIYSTFFPMLTNGKTIGLLISGLRIIHKSGFSTSMANYYFRGLVSSLYLIPFIGQIFMITAFIAAFLARGITPVDAIT